MASNEKVGIQLDMRGVDMVTPVDLLSDGHTPWSKNFRLYAQQSDDRQVAISSRKGPGFYMTPLSEVLDDNLDGNEDNDISIGVTSHVFAQKITIGTSGRLNRLDAKLRRVELFSKAKGTTLVSLYSSDNNKPAELLSQSSFESGEISDEYEWHTARFLNAPLLDEDDVVYAVFEIQDDGEGLYQLSANSTDSESMYSDVSFGALSNVNYSANFRAYVAPDEKLKGAYRFNREDAQNTTVVVYGSTMYSIDPVTDTWTVVTSDLDPLASEYSFARGDGKVFWVNGFDELTAWDGTLEGSHPNLVANPSFDSDISGWTNDDNEVITRDTSIYHTAPASLKVSAATGHEVNYAINLKKSTRYKFSAWVRLSAAGNLVFEAKSDVGPGNENTVATIVNTVPAVGSFQKVEGYFTPTADVKRIKFGTNSQADFYLDDVFVSETGVEYILDPELPILSMVTFHRDRIFGVAANDKNRLVWSEAPGNPSNAPTNEQWYRAWLSTSFWYVPAPKTGSPITGLVSFQDSLIIFTQDNKYVFSGYDRGSFNLRQSTGAKGAIGPRGIVADENLIYFVSDDGFYTSNGSEDENITEQKIQPLFDACPRKQDVTPIVWNNKVRWYMASETSEVNDICPIYSPGLGGEWEVDLDTFIDRAVYYDDVDDDRELLEFSSHYAMPVLAEQGYSSLGAPIDFEYRLKYDSFGVPAQKKRLRRYFPILQGVDNTFKISLMMDKDFEDSPRTKEILLSVNGSTFGAFTLGDGTTFGGDKSFKHHRQSYPGSAYYWQLRVARKGVNNRVAFTGAQYKYRIKRM